MPPLDLNWLNFTMKFLRMSSRSLRSPASISRSTGKHHTITPPHYPHLTNYSHAFTTPHHLPLSLPFFSLSLVFSLFIQVTTCILYGGLNSRISYNNLPSLPLPLLSRRLMRRDACAAQCAGATRSHAQPRWFFTSKVVSGTLVGLGFFSGSTSARI